MHAMMPPGRDRALENESRIRKLSSEGGAAPLLDSHPKPVPILETKDPSQILVAESLLRSAEIQFSTESEPSRELYGASRLLAGYGTLLGSMKLLVDADRVDEARDLLVTAEDAL